MEEWPTVRFGDVVENVRHNIKDREAAGIDRVLGLDDIETGNLHVTGWKDVDSSPSFRTHFKPTQTLFGKRRAYLRKVAYAEFEGVCTQNILVFETKNPEVLLPELLPFICMSEPFMIDAVKHSTGSLFPNADWKSIRDFELKLPPLNIQMQISDLLWSADECIIENTNLSKAVAIMVSSIRENIISPRNGKVVQLGSIISGITAGKSLNADNRLPVDEEKVVLKVGAAGKRFFVPREVKVLKNQEEFLTQYTVYKNDLLISRANTIELVGQSCLVDKNYPNFMLSDKTLRIEVDEQQIPKTILLELLWTLSTRVQLRQLGTGTGGQMKNISQKDIKQMKLKIPKESDYDSIHHLILIMHSMEKKLNNKLSNLKILQSNLVNYFWEG